MRAIIRSFCVIAALWGASPAIAEDLQPGPELVAFLSLLKQDNRSAAREKVVEPVSQASGGPFLTFQGGPFSGQWSKKIFDGRDTVSSIEAFETFSQCRLASYRPARDEDKSSLRILVKYTCDEPDRDAIFFSVQAADEKGMVRMSSLGRAIYVVSVDGDKAILQGAPE